MDSRALIPFLAVLGAIVLFRYAAEVSAAIRDLLRGGPRPPSHPIPADDSRILNRRSRRTAA
jgi:hypothetical protein